MLRYEASPFGNYWKEILRYAQNDKRGFEMLFHYIIV